MKKDIKRELVDAFLLGFAGWYWRMKYWKKRVEMWEKGEDWRYWKAKRRRRDKKFYWWEENDK
jgi:hypothetical protein